MPTYPTSGPVTLKTNLGDYPAYKAIRDNTHGSDLVRFDVAALKTPVDGFKPMVRERAFDCGEIAIVTFLQAKTYGKPLALLPATLVGRFQQNCACFNSERPVKPEELNGKRVGVGSYTTTTGVWVRGVLQHDFGVDPSKVTWVVTADAHLAEFKDPPNVEKTTKKLDQMLFDGEIDAFVTPALPQDPRIKPLIPDAQNVGQTWGLDHGTVQINHMFAVDSDLVAQRPDVVREIYRLLLECRRANGPATTPVDMMPYGDAVRTGVEMMNQFAEEQRIIPKRFTVDELLAETAKAIG